MKRRKRRLKNNGEESRFVTLLKFILNIQIFKRLLSVANDFYANLMEDKHAYWALLDTGKCHFFVY